MAGLWFALGAPMNESAREPRFSAILGAALDRHRLDGSRLVFEIAARSLAGGAARLNEEVQAVADLGVVLAINEFGTGQADLMALRTLPVRKLKIDRRLVSEIVQREDAAIIVQTIAAMAGGLGLQFAASGVETPAQLERLRGYGCNEWQGPLFAAPLDAQAFEELLHGAAGRLAAG